jgi:hypothetical protein
MVPLSARHSGVALSHSKAGFSRIFAGDFDVSLQPSDPASGTFIMGLQPNDTRGIRSTKRIGAGFYTNSY